MKMYKLQPLGVLFFPHPTSTAKSRLMQLAFRALVVSLKIIKTKNVDEFSSRLCGVCVNSIQ